MFPSVPPRCFLSLSCLSSFRISCLHLRERTRWASTVRNRSVALDNVTRPHQRVFRPTHQGGVKGLPSCIITNRSNQSEALVLATLLSTDARCSPDYCDGFASPLHPPTLLAARTVCIVSCCLVIVCVCVCVCVRTVFVCAARSTGGVRKFGVCLHLVQQICLCWWMCLSVCE